MPIPQTANQLRWLAEQADGQRDQELTLSWEGTELKLLPVSQAKIPVVPVHTHSDYEGLPGGARIIIKYEGQEVEIPREADAVFFTQSAVEKFVLPYYMRMNPPWKVQDLKRDLFREGVVVAVHVPPSITKGYPLRPVERAPDGKLNLRAEQDFPVDEPPGVAR
jgi:hypothetical protein